MDPTPDMTRAVADRAEFRVRDSGTGIPDDIGDKLFQRFFPTRPVGIRMPASYAAAPTEVSCDREAGIPTATGASVAAICSRQ
jgi:hypothetical protein